MKKSLFADITLLLIVFVWGSTFLIVQNAIATMPPNTFNAVRFSIAALFLIGVLFLFAANQRTLFSPALIRSGAFIGFWLFSGYGLQTMGLAYTTPSKAGFITGLSVVLVPLFSFFLLKQKVKWQSILGVASAVVGLYLLTVSHSIGLNTGDVLVFFGAFCFAMHIVTTGKYAPTFPALPLAIVQLSTVSLLSWIYAFCFEDWHTAFNAQALLVPDVAWGLFITSIPATALAFLAQTAFQKETTPTRVALIFALEPVFAALISYLWIDEMLTALQFVGCILIFSGMILAELPIAEWLKAWRMQRINAKSRS